MTTPQTNVVGIFEDRAQADHAVAELRRAGFRDDQIMVAAHARGPRWGTKRRSAAPWLRSRPTTAMPKRTPCFKVTAHTAPNGWPGSGNGRTSLKVCRPLDAHRRAALPPRLRAPASPWPGMPNSQPAAGDRVWTGGR